MLRKNIKMRVSADKRGKISTGKKTKTSQGKEYPTSLNYFNIEKFPELIQAYGAEPDKLVVLFPSDVIEEFFFSEYSLWASKNDKAIKKRSCDGESCTHYLAETVGKKDYAAGEISECLCRNEKISAKMDKGKLCKSYTAMKAFVLDLNSGKIISPMCYQFQTGSDNSSDNLYTELEKIWLVTGGVLTKIPFILSVHMVEKIVGTEAQKRKFPIWSLQAWGTTANILEMAGRKQLPTTDETAVQVVIDETKAIEAPVDEALEIIIADIGKQTDPEKLKEIWEKYPRYHNSNDFRDAINNIKANIEDTKEPQDSGQQELI